MILEHENWKWYWSMKVENDTGAWKLKMILEHESYRSWKLPKFLSVIIKYVNDTGAWKLKMILEHESCQSWKLPKLKIAKLLNYRNLKLIKVKVDKIENCQNWKLPNQRLEIAKLLKLLSC